MSNEDQTRHFNNGDEKLDRIIEMLRGLVLRVESIETRLDTLETRMAERRNDTRPLWESVQAQLVALGEGQERIEQKLVVVDHKIDILVKDLFELRTQHSLLEDRVERLERKPS